MNGRSGRRRPAAFILGRRAGLTADEIDLLVGGDAPSSLTHREAVLRAGGTVARSFLVGDTETDRKTASAAGVKVALVAFGPEGEALTRLAPEALLAHFDDLPALARDWLGAA